MTLPIIGITMGDPSGIGPEIIIGSYNHDTSFLNCSLLVIGNSKRLIEASKILNKDIKINECKSTNDIINNNVINCMDIGELPTNMPYGSNSKTSGESAYKYIETAVTLALNNKINAICTAPISKKALHMAGHKYPGHTELLAKLTNTKEVSLMLSTPKLNVIHVTTHMGLLDAISKIEPNLVFRTIERGRKILYKSLRREPRIGVCAINPHAGEEGIFGYGEEKEKIIPAIKKALELKWDIKGPLAADTLFYLAARGDFDLVVAMYHDQGHGPVKVMGIENGVNVTVGLPVIRTSVDHGTAFDIAGKGIADERNIIEALKKASEYIY
jgi:4-phospho-D-threonate 3-dehydrogenase / 4-phospho-D-erythronate 3-dehydrogenase